MATMESRTRTRREFIRDAGLAGVSLAAFSGLAKGAWAADGQPTVVRVQGTAFRPGPLTRAAVDALGGMRAFVKPGQKVVVKPNIGWDRPPELAANTHPEVVTETVRMCLEAGAVRVTVLDRTCNDPRRCYANSGIAAAVEAFGDGRVGIPHIDERRFREVAIPGGTALTKWKFYEDALDADVYLNLPIAKVHAAAVLTLGLKNIMGVLGGNRGMIHRDLAGYLADLNRVIRPALTIMDATRILVAHGPQGGDPADVRMPNMVIAGTDTVAVDSVTTGLFGLKPEDVPVIPKAVAAGLGTADLGRITIRDLRA